MYQHYFKLTQVPFSIAPDPRFLYMSDKHKEALAHLLYGVQSSGAFVVLSGEIGSGKTTVCRCFLEQIPDDLDLAFILNPKLNEQELLASICDEFGVVYPEQASTKILVDKINDFLLNNHSKGRHSLVIIEEAQNLSDSVLEQLRLLTNLETNDKKLLQIILLAQPEFIDILKQPNMKQLAQRITARFHLPALNEQETRQYIAHRLNVAGASSNPFPSPVQRQIYKITKGVPRLINVLCDRCLLGAYAKNQHYVDQRIVKQSWKEIGGDYPQNNRVLLITGSSIIIALMLLLVFLYQQPSTINSSASLEESGLFQHMFPDPGFIENNRYFISARALAELWHFTEAEIQAIDGPKSLCEVAMTKGLNCYSDQASLGLLLKLDRPAILKFVANTGDEYHGLLLGKQNDQYIIRFANRDALLSHTMLQQIWLGHFTVLGKLPTVWQGRALSAGEQNAMAEWLENQLINLGLLDNDYQVSGIYHAEYEPLVKSLQRQAGIYSDGIVGIKTVLYINTLTNEDIPRLGK